MPTDNQARPSRVEIPGDILIPDADFCREVLGGCARRTAKRLEADGLPFIKIRGRTYRPLNAGRAWLASQIKVKTPQRRRAVR
jgi:hypothetical protein